MLFKDREDAGIALSEKLLNFKNQKDTLLIALPRGGVVVAAKIAKALNLPLDIVTPRKIGAPNNKELAIGAICLDESILKNDFIQDLEIDKNYITKTIEEEKRESLRRMKIYRKGSPSLDLKNKTIIIVDDGIATGSTMEVSIKYIKNFKPKKIIIAIPVAPQKTVEYFQKMVDEVICLFTPFDFMAIGEFYENFEQTSDDEVISILKSLKKTV